MTKTKLSKAQVAVLERLANGDKVTRNHYMGWFQKEGAYMNRPYKTVNMKTLDALRHAGLIEEAGIGPTSTDYKITASGSAALEAALAKEKRP